MRSHGCSRFRPFRSPTMLSSQLAERIHDAGGMDDYKAALDVPECCNGGLAAFFRRIQLHAATRSFSSTLLLFPTGSDCVENAVVYFIDNIYVEHFPFLRIHSFNESGERGLPGASSQAGTPRRTADSSRQRGAWAGVRSRR